MSLIMSCDSCEYFDKHLNSFEEAKLMEWSEQEFGHACPVCTAKFAELAELDDPRTTTADLASAMTKPNEHTT
jgi:hypothetical protein